MSDVTLQFANHHEGRDLSHEIDSDNYAKDGVGLALSGGGYKAAAYHLGALIRLNQVGLLGKIARISSVSGGSITAGYLGLHWKDLTFDANGVATDFDAVIVQPLMDFLTEVNLDVPEGILGLLLPFRSGADGVAAGYDKHLFKGKSLQDLPGPDEGPDFMLVSTNYELNSLWRFCRRYAADYRVGLIKEPTFPLARIVAASSAFPPFFCPLTLNLAGQTVTNPDNKADRHEGRFLERALLCDGGVYDNLGLEPIWKRFGTLLVSNAGDAIKEDEHPSEWFGLMLRIIGMMHRQAENNRQRSLMLLARQGQRKVAYWPARNNGDNYPNASRITLPPADIEAAQKEKVRLWSLGAKAFHRLANHGYVLCDSAVRSYLKVGLAAPATQPPFPTY